MSAVPAPIDAVATPAWAALQKHYDELNAAGIDLKSWFASDPERVAKMSFDMGEFHIEDRKSVV